MNKVRANEPISLPIQRSNLWFLRYSRFPGQHGIGLLHRMYVYQVGSP